MWRVNYDNHCRSSYTECKPSCAQQCHKVRLHTILIGVMGTIYKSHTELPLSKLGLDWCRVRKVTLFNMQLRS